MAAMTSRRDVDGGWAWLVLLASYFTVLMTSGLAFIAGVFQVVFLEEFQGSVAYTSWVTALFSSLLQLAGPLSALMTNWTNCRVSVMVGGALLSLGLAASSQADGLPYLLVSFGTVAGIGLGLCYSAAIIVINFFFDVRLTMVTGITLSSAGLGILLAPQISKILFDYFSWRESLVMLAAGSAQICVVGALMFPTFEKDKCHECRAGKCSKYPCLFCLNTESSLSSDIESEFPLHDTEIVVEEVDTEHNCLHYHPEQVTDGIHESRDSSRKLKGHSSLGLDRGKDSIEPDVSIAHEGDRMKLGAIHYDHQAISARDETPKDCLLTSDHSLAGTFQSNNAGKVQNNSIIDPKAFKQHHLRHHLLNIKYDAPGKSQSHNDLTSSSNVQRVTGVPGILLRSHQHLSRLQEDNPRSSARSASLHFTVISRQPSLVHVVPSIHNLDIIVSQGHHIPTSDNSQRLSKRSVAQVLEREMPSTSPRNRRPSLLSVTSKAAFEAPSHTNFPPLAKNIGFLVICAQLFVSNCACGIFNIHLPSFAYSKGLTDQQVTNILSFNGVGVLASRCLVGALANSTHAELLLYWALHILGGIFIMMFPTLGVDYISVSCLVVGVATYYGSVYSILTPITLSWVGLGDLATAFGMEMVCAGLGYFVAPPIAGFLVDRTGSYDYNMYSGGGILILSSMLLLVLPVYQGTRKTSNTLGQNMNEGEAKDMSTKNHADETTS